MAAIEPFEPNNEWIEAEALQCERLLENLANTAQVIADRMDRMHGLMRDIIGDLRAMRT